MTKADTSRDESQKQICWVFMSGACQTKYTFQVQHRGDPVNTSVHFAVTLTETRSVLKSSY